MVTPRRFTFAAAAFAFAFSLTVKAAIITNGLSVTSNAQSVGENVNGTPEAFVVTNLLNVTVTIDTLAFSGPRVTPVAGNLGTDDIVVENSVFYRNDNCTGNMLQVNGARGSSCTFNLVFNTQDTSGVNDKDSAGYQLNGVVDGHTATDNVVAQYRGAVITVVDPGVPEPSSILLLATALSIFCRIR